MGAALGLEPGCTAFACWLLVRHEKWKRLLKLVFRLQGFLLLGINTQYCFLDPSKKCTSNFGNPICFWHQAMFACGSGGRVPWNVKAFMGKILHEPMCTAVPQFLVLSAD